MSNPTSPMANAANLSTSPMSAPVTPLAPMTTPIPGGVPEWSDSFSAAPLFPQSTIPTTPVVDVTTEATDSGWSDDSSNATISPRKGKKVASNEPQSSRVRLIPSFHCSSCLMVILGCLFTLQTFCCSRCQSPGRREREYFSNFI